MLAAGRIDFAEYGAASVSERPSHRRRACLVVTDFRSQKPLPTRHCGPFSRRRRTQVADVSSGLSGQRLTSAYVITGRDRRDCQLLSRV